MNILRQNASGITRGFRQVKPVRVVRSSTVVGQTCPPNKNAPPSFPCVDAHAAREARLQQGFQDAISGSPSSSASSASGPEPPYARPSPKSCKIYHHPEPLDLVYTGSLQSSDIAYETWGTLSQKKDNVILLHTGLSASSHAASTEANPSEGWWDKFIGPGKALDTNQFYIICTNVLGGCYGSTGPSSFHPPALNPDGTTSQGRERYGTSFPVLSIFDMVRAQFKLLDGLGIKEIYASVGSSMGAMQSLAAGWLFPERVGKVVSISGTARSSPSAIAMRFAQRSGGFRCSTAFFSVLTRGTVLMADPNWNKGFYYDGLPPHTGMKLARRRELFFFALFNTLRDHPYPRNRHDHLPIWTGMGSPIWTKV